MRRPLAAISWSGGKDSYLALHRTREHLEFSAAITMFDEDGARSRSHGLRPEVISAQVHRLGLEPLFGLCSWQTYEAEFVRTLSQLHERGISHVVFGDIFTDSHRAWVERVCHACGLTAVEPLWGETTKALLSEFLALGAEARIVTVKAAKLDSSWLGRKLVMEMIAEFERLAVDPAGENGEYHTLVTRAPGFSAPINVCQVARVRRDGCWALDVALENT